MPSSVHLQMMEPDWNSTTTHRQKQNTTDKAKEMKRTDPCTLLSLSPSPLPNPKTPQRPSEQGTAAPSRQAPTHRNGPDCGDQTPAVSPRSSLRDERQAPRHRNAQTAKPTAPTVVIKHPQSLPGRACGTSSQAGLRSDAMHRQSTKAGGDSFHSPTGRM